MAIVGPDGNNLYEEDTIGGVPAYIYMEAGYKINTQRGFEPFDPNYDTDFPSCVSQDNPAEAIRTELLRSLGNSLKWNVVTNENTDNNTVDVKIYEDAETSDWSINFSINLRDGSVENFPPSTVDGR